MGLYEKMYNVMEESEALLKNMEVGSGSYNYKAISEAEVLNKIKPLFKKHKLILFPIESSIIQDGKLTQITAKYKIVDIESGESEILATVGNGSDSGDKGSGKAWTYAYKALLQKTFMLFSGEDTDNTHSEDLNTLDKNKKISVRDIEALAKQANIEIQFIIDSYNEKNKKSIDELQFMPQENKLHVYNWLQGKVKK